LGNLRFNSQRTVNTVVCSGFRSFLIHSSRRERLPSDHLLSPWVRGLAPGLLQVESWPARKTDRSPAHPRKPAEDIPTGAHIRGGHPVLYTRPDWTSSPMHTSCDHLSTGTYFPLDVATGAHPV